MMRKTRILFIGIGFYDYDAAIVKEFNILGYDVDYYCEVPCGIKYRYYQRIKNHKKLQSIIYKTSMNIASTCSDNYDIVFVIKGEFLTQESIDYIKSKNQKGKWILYLWDSLIRFPKIRDKFKNFDKIYSFDRLDCLSTEKLNFNPLFFRKEYDVKNIQKGKEVYDIYFLGWYHSDRLQLVKKIANYCEQNKIKHKMILYVGYISFIFESIFGGEFKGQKKYLVFKSISTKINFDFIIKSKIILDIAHPLQSGLTMRTIELLGVQKKIITTNSDVVNYDFYHPDNVLVIDRENPILDIDFFKKDYYPISQKIRERYSITNWLKRMID